MTIVDSLKKLLTKFGGNASALEENATSSDVIDAIADAYTDKEGTYTEVTPIGSEGTKIATIKTNNTPHDIYAPKELPAVTAEDYEKILQVDDQGNWVAVPDRFHVGDEYRIVGNSINLCPIQNVANRMFQLLITLPKDVGSDVKWAWFKTGSKCSIYDLKGNNILPYDSVIDETITCIVQYTCISGHGCQFFLQLKDGDLSEYTMSDILAFVSNGAVIEFLAEKPTT